MEWTGIETPAGSPLPDRIWATVLRVGVAHMQIPNPEQPIFFFHLILNEMNQSSLMVKVFPSLALWKRRRASPSGGCGPSRPEPPRAAPSRPEPPRAAPSRPEPPREQYVPIRGGDGPNILRVTVALKLMISRCPLLSVIENGN